MARMSDKVRQILAVWRERACHAEDLLGRGDVDGALAVLRKQWAAFQNFRAASVRAGSDGDLDADLSEMSARTQRLTERLEAERASVQRQLQDLRRGRQILGNFQSSRGAGPTAIADAV